MAAGNWLRYIRQRKANKAEYAVHACMHACMKIVTHTAPSGLEAPLVSSFIPDHLPSSSRD